MGELPRGHHRGWARQSARGVCNITQKYEWHFRSCLWCKAVEKKEAHPLHMPCCAAKAKCRIWCRPFHSLCWNLQRLFQCFVTLCFRSQPKPRILLPGMSAKVLRNGMPTGNMLALRKIGAQRDTMNWLQESMSNTAASIPPPIGVFLNAKFKQASEFAVDIGVSELSDYDSNGKSIKAQVSLWDVPSSQSWAR